MRAAVERPPLSFWSAAAKPPLSINSNKRRHTKHEKFFDFSSS
jgi:hypothetical protein